MSQPAQILPVRADNALRDHFERSRANDVVVPEGSHERGRP